MLLLSQMAVLLLLALIAGVFLVMLRHGNRRDSQIRDTDSEAFPNPWHAKHSKNGPMTVVPDRLIMEQLNPKTMKSVKEFKVGSIPKEGVSISRPNAEVDDGILLSKATSEAFTVSPHHAVIAEDEKGLFIQDCHSKNNMFDKDHNKVEELDITDGMIVYLGRQPVRFSIPAWYSDDDMSGDADANITRFYEDKMPNVPITVVRRRKR